MRRMEPTGALVDIPAGPDKERLGNDHSPASAAAHTAGGDERSPGLARPPMTTTVIAARLVPAALVLELVDATA